MTTSTDILPKILPRFGSRGYKIGVIVLFGLHVVALSLFAVYRFVDWDEGFYLQAGRSVSSGLRIYTDFFYPQAPLYPYLLALLPGTGWDYWLQARFVSVLLSVATMALVVVSVKRLVLLSPEPEESSRSRESTRYYVPVLVALSLYSICGLFLAWNSVAKPLALSQFLLMAGVCSRLMAHKQTTFRYSLWMLAAGVFLALAAQTRSPMLVAWLVTLVSSFTGVGWKRKCFSVGLFVTGSVLAALPSIFMSVRDSSRFYFDNFGFHLSRTDPPSLVDTLSDKLNFITRTAFDPQIAILLVLVLIILLSAFRLRPYRDVLLSINFYPLAVGALIIGGYFLAFPSHRQYVTQGLPAIIVFVAANSDRILDWFQSSKARFHRFALAVVVAVYALGIAPYVWIYFTASRERDRRCEQSRVSEVVSVIEQNSMPTDTILSELPIYAVLANRPQARRAEFVGFEYMSLSLGDKYGLMNLADSAYIASIVTGHKVKLVVVENTADSGLAKALLGNYQMIYEDSFGQIWKVLP